MICVLGACWLLCADQAIERVVGGARHAGRVGQREAVAGKNATLTPWQFLLQ